MNMEILNLIYRGYLGKVWYEPGFDGDGAWELANRYIAPITSFLLLLVPVVAAAVALYSYVQWALKDEDEREQRPYGKSLKKILIGAIIAESIAAIFKIFGL